MRMDWSTEAPGEQAQWHTRQSCCHVLYVAGEDSLFSLDQHTRESHVVAVASTDATSFIFPQVTVWIVYNVSPLCMWLTMFLNISHWFSLTHPHLHTSIHSPTCPEYKAGQNRRRKEIAPVSRGNAGNRRISGEDLEHGSMLYSLSPRICWKTSTALIAFCKHIALRPKWEDLFCMSNLHTIRDENTFAAFCWFSIQPHTRQQLISLWINQLNHLIYILPGILMSKSRPYMTHDSPRAPGNGTVFIHLY